jgi:hypothetical protein
MRFLSGMDHCQGNARRKAPEPSADRSDGWLWEQKVQSRFRPAGRDVVGEADSRLPGH